MRTGTVVEQIERLEDQLQAVKWMVRAVPVAGRSKHRSRVSIVTRTAGLLRGRLPSGRVYQRRLRREWEARVAREAR